MTIKKELDELKKFLESEPEKMLSQARGLQMRDRASKGVAVSTVQIRTGSEAHRVP